MRWGVLLDQALQREDDGSALFLLDAAQELLHVLEEPIRTQVYLRNILEMTFDGMERASQRERFERLCQIYPDIGKLCDPVNLPETGAENLVFAVRSLFGLRLLEQALYFQQDKQHIARCDYCWGWFIPKTKKATRYCDRVTDGFPCKKRGSRYKRNLIEDEDGALKICNQLRDRYEADRAEQIVQTVWQKRVAGDISFDPEVRYPERFSALILTWVRRSRSGRCTQRTICGGRNKGGIRARGRNIGRLKKYYYTHFRFPSVRDLTAFHRSFCPLLSISLTFSPAAIFM